MANMSYCRFENTATDLQDCIYALEEALENGKTMKEFHRSLSSSYEQSAFRRLMSLCEEIQAAVNELEEAEGFEVDDVEQGAILIS